MYSQGRVSPVDPEPEPVEALRRRLRRIAGELEGLELRCGVPWGVPHG